MVFPLRAGRAGEMGGTDSREKIVEYNTMSWSNVSPDTEVINQCDKSRVPQDRVTFVEWLGWGVWDITVEWPSVG